MRRDPERHHQCVGLRRTIAVRLQSGGSVTNQSGGLINGGHFGIGDAGPLFVDNQAGGTITSLGFGVVGFYKAGTR
jgi:hypothetical protein